MNAEFPGNSRSSRPTPPKAVQKMIPGEAIIRKKPLGKRFMETFFGTDSMKSLGSNLLWEVFLPGLRDSASRTLHEGIDRGLGTNRRIQPNFPPNVSGGLFGQMMTNYTTPSAAVGAVPRPEPRSASGAGTDASQIVLPNRLNAEVAIDSMIQYLNEYGQVSVADLCSIVGKDAAFTDAKWGWTSLNGVIPRHIHGGGYVLDLPAPIPLKTN